MAAPKTSIEQEFSASPRPPASADDTGGEPGAVDSSVMGSISLLHDSLELARERQLAAERRAADLARANAAMRSTMEAMTSIPALDDLLARVMVSINQQLGSAGSTLWIFDELRSRLHLTCLHGRVSSDPPEVQGFRATPDIEPRDDAVDRRRALLGFQHLFLPDAWKAPDLDESTSEWMKAVGAIGLLLLPLKVGGRVIALLSVHKPDNVPFPDEQVELAVALAQQAALAIHVSQLAEEAKQSAIPREQEEAATQRAAVLARANAAMAKTVGRLVEQPDIRNFIGEVLSVFATEFDAVGVEYWGYVEETGRFDPSLSFDRASGTVSGDDNEWRKLESQRVYEDLKQRESNFAGRISRFTNDDFETRLDFLPFRETLQEQGVLTILSVPMFIQRECFGVICMRLNHQRTLNQSEEELAFALAQQLALALQMTRLAEEAKQAAIAKEREQAAVSRAAELMRANRAIGSSLAKLTAYPDLQSFLGQVLTAIVSELGEKDGGVWLYDADEDQLSLRQSLEEGVFRFGPWPGVKWVYADGHGVNDGREENGGNGSASPARKAASREVKVHEWEEIESRPEWAVYRETLRAGGFQCLMEVPMFVGSELLGYYAIRARQHATFSSTEVELAQALANQATLACHLKQLAEKAEQAAVAREQDRATLAERTRISEEIHDGIQQVFTAILLQLGTAQRQLEEIPEASAGVRNAVARAETLAETGLEEVGRSVSYLRDSAEKNPSDLHRSLDVLCRSVDSDGLRCRFSAHGPAPAISSAACKEIYRICQEAISNACKHARAGEILLRAHSDLLRYRLTISDDGCGFEVPGDALSCGLGMRTMQERAKRIGGACEVRSSPGSGTVVSVTVELPRPAAPERS